MSALQVNSPSAVCGEVVSCEPRSGAEAYDLVVAYKAQRGRETVDLIAAFYVGKYNIAVCETLSEGDRVVVEFLVNCKERQGGCGYWTNLDVRTIKKQGGAAKEQSGPRASDKLNYRKADDDRELPF